MRRKSDETNTPRSQPNSRNASIWSSAVLMRDDPTKRVKRSPSMPRSLCVRLFSPAAP